MTGPPRRLDHRNPPSLRTVVGLLLQSRFPMFVAWGKDLGFLYNDPYSEILGAKHPAALGKRFYDIWSEIWPDIGPLIDAAMAGEATYREDLPLVMTRKGYDEQTWFTFSYSPVRDESGNVAGMFCAFWERTPKVLAEKALRENERRLLALNETLERRVTEALAERKLLADIVEGTDAFERVYGVRPNASDNLLDLLATQPEHQLEVKAAWGRALSGEQFTAIQQFGNPARDRRSYEIRFNTLRDRDGNRIGASRVRRHRSSARPGSPARDAIPDGGVIRIRVDNVQADRENGAAAASVRISIADTGQGMSSEVQARAFEPFFTTKDVGKGSGLGLPQVYGFAQQSAGRVTIASELGTGTTVTLLLPRSLRDPEVTKAVDTDNEPARLDATRRGHALLVEDDKDVSALTSELLRSLGFTVTHVASADAALSALAGSRHIDIVLSDVMMPGGVSGLELARDIRRRHPGIPVVLTTGYVESVAGMKDGEFDVLLKPFSGEALAKALGVVR